jgi:hypothetical protein
MKLALLPLLALFATAAAAAPAKTKVSFESSAFKGRHITAKPKGGLILGSTVIGNKEVFTLVDLNGAPLKSGDSVQITYPSGKHDTYWYETGKNVSRIGEGQGAATTFKVLWKQPNETLQLRTATGKFVAGTGKGKDIVTSKATDPNTIFVLVKNPTPVKPAPKKTASPAAAKPGAKSAKPK